MNTIHENSVRARAAVIFCVTRYKTETEKQNFYRGRKMFVTSEASYLVMCSSKKYPYPPPATEGNGNSEGRGVRKEAISEGVGGC